MVRESLTEQQANAGLDPALVAAGRLLLATALDDWRQADAATQFAFRNNPDLAGLGDRLTAVSGHERALLWVAENDWSGFPDPSEFVLIGFDGADNIFALTHFDDWPEHWNDPAAEPSGQPEKEKRTAQ